MGDDILLKIIQSSFLLSLPLILLPWIFEDVAGWVAAIVVLVLAALAIVTFISSLLLVWG